MMFTATVTSKRQVTLPVILFAELGIAPGDKLRIEKKRGEFVVSSEKAKLRSLMGRVKRPALDQKLTVDEMIGKAKEEYWKNKVV